MSSNPEREFDAGVSEFLCFSVYSANLAFNRVYKPMLAGLGLTYPQYLVLVSLWAEDGQTVGRLGEQLFLESNTLTPLLKRLEAMGYIDRARNPDDERQVRAVLTAKGKALRKKAECIPEGILKASGMTAKDLKRLSLEINALRDRLLGPDAA